MTELRTHPVDERRYDTNTGLFAQTILGWHAEDHDGGTEVWICLAVCIRFSLLKNGSHLFPLPPPGSLSDMRRQH